VCRATEGNDTNNQNPTGQRLGDLTLEDLDEILDDPARIWELLRMVPRHDRSAALA
jgi:hypothetical protein